MGPCPRDCRRDRGQAAVGDPGHRQGDLGVAGQALPCRLGSGPDLHAAGQPAGHRRTGGAARLRRQGCQERTKDPLMSNHPLSQRIADVLDLQPRGPAIEYDGRWLSWGQVGEAARRMAVLTAEHNDDPAIGMLLRNRPGQVAAFLGVLLAGGTVVTINPSRGDERTRSDIATLRLPLVVGEPDDLATLVAPGTPTLSISGCLDEPGESVRPGSGPVAAP